MAKFRYDILDNEIQQKAIKFRRDHGFSNAEPIRLKSLLLKCNVLTVFRQLSEDFSGMAVKIGEDRFMMVNHDHSLGKQHFTIAHELYHLFIQENFISQSCVTGRFDRKDIEEYKADMFAAYLLLPQEGLTMGINPMELSNPDTIRLETVMKLEQYYSVSRRAILQRLKNIGVITNKTFELYKLDVRRSAAAYGYEMDLYLPGNKDLVLGDYGVKAHQLFENDVISESHYLELMRVIGYNPNDQQFENEKNKDIA
ncbi:ImmA/IrrE family metallo-endopeptidase [Sphingobacterium daejeonense]|uniref:ImmA/IrrE family metallo-endopeptidase n=1 Tax=Sphingobacterium daejeonense TaxID=371142 RepID=UPI0021A4B3A2|nr:ImmA/IrrE family metallo-endopeptidase [Sphingobacterium daejeonense]MCT1532320.1 ImmA/IrrE family metallo-endopeptidase [Sphingobacterium daejeonense]